MKRYFRSFSALTLCVLCLISMVALIFAVESNTCPEGGSHYYGTSVDCNDWYNFRFIHETMMTYVIKSGMIVA